MATDALPPRGSRTPQSRGQNWRWPTIAPGGYITSATWGVPTLKSNEQNQRWPTSGLGGNNTPAASGFPNASERERKSDVAHKYARRLHNPSRLGGCLTSPGRGTKSDVAYNRAGMLQNPSYLGGPQRFRAHEKIRGGPQVGRVTKQPLPPWGFPTFHNAGQDEKCPTSGPGGYITPVTWGGGGPQRFKGEDKIRGGQQ